MFAAKTTIRRIPLAAAFAFLIFTSANFAQTAAPEKAAKNFYEWYLHELNNERYPISKQKSQTLKRISKRLGKWIYSKAYEEYGADYFIDAQDWDENWENGIKTSKAAVKGNTATLKVNFFSKQGNFGNYTLNVKLVKETGIWKIDRVSSQR